MIRLAQEKDYKKIVEFNLLLAQETEGITLEIERLTKGVKKILFNAEKGQYFVYQKDGKIIGQLLITYEWSDWRNCDFWWIQSVYVEKKYRNQGIFKSLYNFVKELALANNHICGLRLYVERKNEIAKKAYQNLNMHHSIYDLYEWEK